MKAEVLKKGDGQTRFAGVSGLMSGMMGTLVGFPMETIKTRIQSDWTATGITSKMERGGSRRVVMDTFNSLGLRGFYRGIGTPMLTTGGTNAAVFYVYEKGKLIMIDPKESSLRWTLGAICGSAFLSGGMTAFWTAPLQCLKTRMQLSTEKGAYYTHSMLKEVFAQHGIRGGMRNFYRGFPLIFFMDSLGRTTYFVMYEMIKSMYEVTPLRLAIERRRGPEGGFTPNPTLTILPKPVMYSLAGVAGWTSIFWLDTVKARMYSVPFEEPLRVGRIFSELYRNLGVRGFYRGWSWTIFRAAPVAVINLGSYDVIQSCFQWMDSQRQAS